MKNEIIRNISEEIASLKDEGVVAFLAGFDLNEGKSVDIFSVNRSNVENLTEAYSYSNEGFLISLELSMKMLKTLARNGLVSAQSYNEVFKGMLELKRSLNVKLINEN